MQLAFKQERPLFVLLNLSIDSVEKEGVMRKRVPVPATSFAEWFIECALSNGAIALEECELRNGQTRPYRVNPEKFSSVELIDKVLFACNNAIRKRWPTPSFDVLYGFPLGERMMHASAIARKLSGMVLNRWEGSRAIRPLDEVLLISDIIDSEREEDAIRFINGRGGNSIGICVVFNQQERTKWNKLSAAQEFERKHNIPVVAAATLEDLIRVLKKKEGMEKIINKIAAYQKKYCVC